MAVVAQPVSLSRETLQRIQAELRRREIPGWLLYNFRGVNPVASALLGLPAMSRRYLVLIPAEGEPVALTHRIEQQPWRGWMGEKRVYLGWRDLERELREMLAGTGRAAMEYAPDDAVPTVDHVPAGVVELVRAAGAEVVSSADLISVFYARWMPDGEASHRRAAAVLQETARGAFRRIEQRFTAGESLTEWALRGWILEQLGGRGLSVGVDCIVAVNANAANPHYAPTADDHATIGAGDLVLVDLWGKEAESAVYADQTWMGYVGDMVAERLQGVWEAVRDARDAAVALVHTRWQAGQTVAGYEADDAARSLIAERGWGEHFIHRTGHSIDRELHGAGPNLDNLETRDTRELIAGIGCSVEPGIYLPGDIGIRSEINVFMAPGGPEVTTPNPQREMFIIGTRK